MEEPRKPGRLAASPKQALNLRIDARIIRRLKHHAIEEGKTVSDLVTEWARQHIVMED